MLKQSLTKSYCLVWMLLLILILTVGCSDDTTSKKATSVAKKSKPQAKKTTLQSPVEAEEEIVPEVIFSPTGRRDPFKPLVTKQKKQVKEENVPLTPLQNFDLGQFRLQAVLIGKGAPRAMVGAPDGKTYILSPGIKIGKRDGVITEITREAVHVEEVLYDLDGTANKQVSTIDMPEQKLF